MAPSVTICVLVLLAALVYASGAAVVADRLKENKATKLTTDDSVTVKKMLQDSNAMKQESNVSSSTVTHLTNEVFKEENENKSDDKLLTNKISSEGKRRTAAGRKTAKKGKKSNSDLLRDLGLTKVRTPNTSHHRKRLASQSRKTHAQKQTGDSQMFVIKLPPHPYYYGHVKPNVEPAAAPSEKSLTKTVNTLPVDFKFNGKPARVYHWNLPVMKKMVARKTGGSSKMSVITGDSDIFDIKKQSTWDENEEDDPTLYRKTSYYRPRRPTKHTFYKYFTGNGRPQSFYVIEKSKKPVTYHRLLP